MTTNGWAQILVFFTLLTALTRPLGGFMYRVFAGEATLIGRLLGPAERSLYRLAGIDTRNEQHWTGYATAMLLFNLLGFLVVFAVLMLQGMLPLNPQKLAGLTPDLAFNTALSFVTNTNWQSYGGESTLSYFSQMAALAVQNFVSAATGIAIAIALVRGFARKSAKTVGNFWIDLTRATLYVLLPLSFVFALILVWQGVPQNFLAYIDATTLEGAHQSIAQGPVASQEAIKMLGTNGGGFFNANSAHPYENPNTVTNLLEMLAILLIPAALTNTFGRFVRDELQGWALYSAMAVLFLAGVALCYWAESNGNPALSSLGIDQTPSVLQSGGNMEGKDVRFGIANSALWTTATTDASNGSVNSMHDSFTPLGGFVPLLNILLGEIIFGGAGSGLYGILLYAILTVFIAGLMVGRTPEYLGKKIEAKEVKMTMLAILCLTLALFVPLAIACVSDAGLSARANNGPHGFAEMFYAYASAVGNNGSAFAGLSANTPFWNITLGLSMLIGRFAYIVPVMAIAGSLVEKRIAPPSAGTFPTKGAMFIVLLVGIILIVSGLTYFPALALGPIAEHLAMLAGARF
jgi:K+-transporting ATPase ATPase A chain